MTPLASIPLHDTVGYVAAAYTVLFVLLLVYLAIMARRVKRVERELLELTAAEAAQDTEQARELPGNGAVLHAGVDISRTAGTAGASGEPAAVPEAQSRESSPA